MISWMNTTANAATTNEIHFFNQTLKPDPLIEKYYYSELPYEFLALKGCLYFHDDNLSITQSHSHTIELNLFFNETIFLKKINIKWETSSSNQISVKQVTLKQIQKTLIAGSDQANLSFYLNRDQSRTLYDQKNRVTFAVETSLNVKDFKMNVHAYGLNRNAIFMIIRHLLRTRHDKTLNEDLLRSLYLTGYTTILPLFKYEEYTELFLPKDSLFYLPVNTDFSTDLRKTTLLLKEGKYPSKEGVKRLPDLQQDKERFLYIDQKKIRFLRLKKPHENIKIQKIDLAD